MPKSKFPTPLSGKKLEGVLQQPYNVPNPKLLPLFLRKLPPELHEETRRHSENFVDVQIAARVEALRDHYSKNQAATKSYSGRSRAKEPLSDRQLLVELAKDFIIGFQPISLDIKVTKGRKARQVTPEDAKLVVAILKFLREGKSLMSACSILAKQPGAPWKGKKPTVLKSRFARTLKYHRREHSILYEDKLYYSYMRQFVEMHGAKMGY